MIRKSGESAFVASQNQLIANNMLLNAIASQQGLHRDCKLATVLGITPSQVSKIRHGTIPIGATLQLSILIAGHLTLKQLRLYVPSSLASVRNVKDSA